ncbi:hypothetical protein CY34DRAFT_19675 [Suillus luteus UH-Slu-Lm8-n1]|uniref:Uncharacterized protein n=1 Tax=Suillus luteus UH-Slu-Lm8-n1 TaxID=930992 RepID=A0A0C9Z2J6_9AGAM|nr:hypothetical protein CY34DRAFT_19675 [Suillus luteus UH-Slu-Lm8-n1]
MLSLPVMQQGNYSARRMGLDVDARQKIKEASPSEAFKQAALTLRPSHNGLCSAATQRRLLLYRLIPSQTFLAAADVEDRLRRATEHFVKQSSIQEVSKKIASAGDESSRRS